jgi:hypothetical protein
MSFLKKNDVKREDLDRSAPFDFFFDKITKVRRSWASLGRAQGPNTLIGQMDHLGHHGLAQLDHKSFRCRALCLRCRLPGPRSICSKLGPHVSDDENIPAEDYFRCCEKDAPGFGIGVVSTAVSMT